MSDRLSPFRTAGAALVEDDVKRQWAADPIGISKAMSVYKVIELCDPPPGHKDARVSLCRSIRRSIPARVTARRPRARQSRRLSAGHRRPRTASRSGPSDDLPAQPDPPRHAQLGYGLSKCPVCGSPLLVHGHALICPNRRCEQWGRPA